MFKAWPKVFPNAKINGVISIIAENVNVAQLVTDCVKHSLLIVLPKLVDPKNSSLVPNLKEYWPESLNFASISPNDWEALGARTSCRFVWENSYPEKQQWLRHMKLFFLLFAAYYHFSLVPYWCTAERNESAATRRHQWGRLGAKDQQQRRHRP